MARGKRTPTETRAEAIAYAKITTYEQSAEEYGVSERSIKRWKKQQAEDAELARLVTKKRAEIAEAWGSRIGPVIEKAIEFAERSLGQEGMDPQDPQALKAANGTAKIFAEIALARDILSDDQHENSRSASDAGENVGPIVGQIGQA